MLFMGRLCKKEMGKIVKKFDTCKMIIDVPQIRISKLKFTVMLSILSFLYYQLLIDQTEAAISSAEIASFLQL